MRKYPIYFLIDTSRFMAGAPLRAFKDVILAVHKILSNDPAMLESGYYSIISFGNEKPQIVAPLAAIADRDSMALMQGLEASGRRVLGEGLRLLQERLSQEVQLGAAGKKSDWKGCLVLFCGGESADAVNGQRQFLDRYFKNKVLVTFNNKVAELYQSMALTAYIIDPLNHAANSGGNEIAHAVYEIITSDRTTIACRQSSRCSR